MPNPAPKIFLSSTSRDLTLERNIACDAINRNYFCINMEKWSGSPYPPKYKIIEELKQASAVVLILGFKYGSLINNEEISYTEFEFNYAKEHGIDIYAFIKKDKNRKEECDEIENEIKNKFKNFKEKLQDGRTVVYFKDINELQTEILNTLSKNNDKIQKNKYFTNKFFEDKLKSSIDDLGPRYNPKINVNLELDFFNVMAKNKIFKENFTKKYISYYCELKKLKLPTNHKKPFQNMLKKIKNEYDLIFKDIQYDFSKLYDLIKNINAVNLIFNFTFFSFFMLACSSD
jgi:gas vesicle protein